jgi:cell wall assembly regulator SMI1
MERENKIWKLIAEEIKRILPKTYKTLNPPADTKQIEYFEKQLSVQLPLAFKSYLQVFNGQTKQGDDFSLVRYYRFLPLEKILELIKQQIFLFGDEEPIGHITENKVKPVLWDNLWIPFAEFNGTDRLILDLNAGKNGQNGQVILYYPGIDMESDEIVVAISFENFGEELLYRLKNNEFEIENNAIQFKDLWIV